MLVVLCATALVLYTWQTQPPQKLVADTGVSTAERKDPPMGDGLRITILRDKTFSPPDGYRHKYGGGSGFVRALPDCKVCRQPLKLLFEFDLSDPALHFLNLPQLAFLPVLSCVDCDLAYVGELFYRVRADAIEVLHSDAVTRIEDWDTACPERNIIIAPVPEEQRPSHYKDADAWHDFMEESEVPKHQLAGTPSWVQGEHGVSCVECSRPMRFLGQVDSETWSVAGQGKFAGHMFGDMGILYVHYCDSCDIVATGGDGY